MNETNKKQLEIMNSEKLYKLWIGGRKTRYANFLRCLAKAGIKVVEVKKPENKPINWVEDEF